MKPILMLTALAMISMAYNTRPVLSVGDDTQKARLDVLQYKQKFSIGCAATIASFDLSDSANMIPLLDGWGNYRMPVTTTNDSAEIYFEQGINMYYGFHIIEALASFERSVQFDSNFAMGYWGKALSYGPNINDLGYAASPEALIASAKAKALNSNCTPVEKALIDAVQVRYSADTTQSREHLNQLYADAMKNVYARFPNSADAATLYVDALMIQHPWDLYDRYGMPKSWTPLIVQTLETILKQSSNHPGASHYYIHAVEASAHPEKALDVASRLPGLMPGVAHLVHMPAHIYIRTGYYDKGIEVNRQAVKGYNNYLLKYPAVAGNAPLYIIHNLHMEATCANMDGRYTDAMKASIDCRNSFDSSWLSIPDFLGVFVQYIYMTPYLTQIRFGKWNDVLAAHEIPSAYIYANLLWHYGRGLAFARKHDFDNATKELATLRSSLENDQLKAPAPNFANPGINGARVAEKILSGIIAEEQNNLPQSVALLNEAVQLEDAMIYDEPKDWVHPVRQYLGNVLIKSGNYAAAENVFRKDLEANPKNGWSYTRLAIALSKEGKTKEAATAKTDARNAFERSDIKISEPVY